MRHMQDDWERWILATAKVPEDYVSALRNCGIGRSNFEHAALVEGNFKMSRIAHLLLDHGLSPTLIKQQEETLRDLFELVSLHRENEKNFYEILGLDYKNDSSLEDSLNDMAESFLRQTNGLSVIDCRNNLNAFLDHMNVQSHRLDFVAAATKLFENQKWENIHRLYIDTNLAKVDHATKILLEQILGMMKTEEDPARPEVIKIVKTYEEEIKSFMDFYDIGGHLDLKPTRMKNKPKGEALGYLLEEISLQVNRIFQFTHWLPSYIGRLGHDLAIRDLVNRNISNEVISDLEGAIKKILYLYEAQNTNMLPHYLNIVRQDLFRYALHQNKLLGRSKDVMRRFHHDQHLRLMTLVADYQKLVKQSRLRDIRSFCVQMVLRLIMHLNTWDKYAESW